MVKTLKQFERDAHKIWSIQSKFYRLGIDLKINGEVGFNFYDYPCIMEDLGKLDFFEELNFSEKIALALAVKQEEINNYLHDSELREVSDFFGVKIDQHLVSKIGSRFI